MEDPLNIEKIEKTPLLKEKKPRPPQSEKQKEAFKKAREKLAERHNKIKETKILDAKRTLLEKEGYIKPTPKEESIQFKIDETDESGDDKEPIKEIQKEKPKKQPKQETTKPLIKEEKKKVVKKEISRKPEPETETESEDSVDSSSSEEIVIIKRTKKNKKSQPKVRRTKSYDEYEDDDVEPVASLPNYNNYFL
jgi:hypothetical protein